MSSLLNVGNISYYDYLHMSPCLHHYLHLVVPKKSMIVVLVRAIGFGTLWLVSSLPASRSNTWVVDWSGAYNTKNMIQTCTTCFCVPFSHHIISVISTTLLGSGQVSWVSGILREETFKYPSFPTATATSGSCW